MKNDKTKNLSEEEMKYYFKLLKQGNKKGLSKLVEGNVRFVTYICNKYQNEYIEFEDLFQTGCIGLIKAIRTFDIDKGYKFTTYAAQVIGNEIKMLLKKLKKTERNVSFDTIIVENDKNSKKLTLEQVLASNENIEEDYLAQELTELAQSSLNILNERARRILEYYFGFRGQRLSQREIARLFGLEQSTVSKIVTKSLKQMRAYLKNNEDLEIRNFDNVRSNYVKKKDKAK